MDLSQAGEASGVVLLPRPDGSLGRLPHAVVRWTGGRIVEVAPRADPGPDVLLLPGFVDLHTHWPQAGLRGRFDGPLLSWLEEKVWPAEAAFCDPAVAERDARAFIHSLLAAGTTAALMFGPPFVEATRRMLAIAPPGFRDGPAIMERNAPDPLCAAAAHTCASVDLLPAAERCRAVISPRFAPAMTAAGLAACARTARRSGLPIQSHLAENSDEVAWVKALFPQAYDYTDVYDRAGLLGPTTILAHGVHLSERELSRLGTTGTIIAHCPTSNEALHSGRMPLERLRAHGVGWVLATDVGAGPQVGMLDVVRCFLDVHAHAGVPTTASEAIARCSAIPGAFLADLDANLRGLGTFEPGAPAHVQAYTLPPGRRADDYAEPLARALVLAAEGHYERAPQRVWLWGEALEV